MGAYTYKPPLKPEAAAAAPEQPVKQDAPASAPASAPAGGVGFLGLERDPQTGALGWRFPGAQRFHDILNRFENNFLLNTADPITAAVAKVQKNPGDPDADLTRLRLLRAQMNQQMPTQDKAVADTLGQINPTLLLRPIKDVGPIVQGAVQEGVKGYAQGESWPRIARDAAVGAAGGTGGAAVGTPNALGTTTGAAVTSGVPALAGWLYGGRFDDALPGAGGPLGAGGAAMAGKYLFDPVNEAIKNAVSSSVPGWATGVASQAPLAGASYWNQLQRDRDTLSGRQ